MSYDMVKAHQFSSHHKAELAKDKICGCFYCLTIFSPEEITEWLEESGLEKQQTAVCPYCGVDSVIGESSGFPITKEFLGAMNEHWFGEMDQSLENSSITVQQDIFALGEEPLPGLSPDDLRGWYKENHTGQGLADAYAAVYNQMFWVEDDIYDYEEGTPEYAGAVQIVDSWCELLKELESDILAVLGDEGIKTPDDGIHEALTLFLEKHSYLDKNGWWIWNGKEADQPDFT